MNGASTPAGDRIDLVIRVDGEELPGSVPILGVEVCSQLNRIPYARLRLADGDPARTDFPLSSGDWLVPGKTLTILAGYRDDTRPIFSGVVLSQRVVVRRGGSRLEVECRDPAFKMTLTRRSRSFEEMSDSQVAESLVSECGLTARMTATEVVHPELLQYRVSDWDFMVTRLEANGQVCLAEDGAVRSLIPSLQGEPELEVAYGSNLLELDVGLDARTQSGSLQALAWDPAAQALVEAEAADPGWEGNGNLSGEDLSSAAERPQDWLRHGGSLSADAAQAWADGALLRARLAASRGRVRLQGSAAVRPGGLLRLAGVGDRFNGKVYVTGVRHEFSGNDWLTDAELGLSPQLHAERFAVAALPAAGTTAAVSGLQIGIVTQLADDPAGEHRLRVKLPLAGTEEQGVWARVATLDAGQGRGTFFRPEVDDEVVLGFFDDDPSQPVVLGMLHSSAKPPPLEATEDNHEKAYVSRNGIALRFDDHGKVAVLETPGGNRLTLTDADAGLSLEDQHGNRLSMDADGIVVSSVKDLVLEASADLKAEGLNAELAATAAFKAEGSASAEVSSSGTLTVKGTLVQIN